MIDRVKSADSLKLYGRKVKRPVLHKRQSKHPECRKEGVVETQYCSLKTKCTVAAVYDRRFFLKSTINPAVIDRRYRRGLRVLQRRPPAELVRKRLDLMFLS